MGPPLLHQFPHTLTNHPLQYRISTLSSASSLSHEAPLDTIVRNNPTKSGYTLHPFRHHSPHLQHSPHTVPSGQMSIQPAIQQDFAYLQDLGEEAGIRPRLVVSTLHREPNPLVPTLSSPVAKPCQHLNALHHQQYQQDPGLFIHHRTLDSDRRATQTQGMPSLLYPVAPFLSNTVQRLSRTYRISGYQKSFSLSTRSNARHYNRPHRSLSETG